MDLYFLTKMSIYSIKYFSPLQLSNESERDKGKICSFSMSQIESAKFSLTLSFLYFSSAKRTKHSMNWNLISPLSGTSTFPFQSAPDMEFVVINVKSVIFKGVSLFTIFACWQNYVHALLEMAHVSPNGLQDEKYLYANLMAL